MEREKIKSVNILTAIIIGICITLDTIGVKLYFFDTASFLIVFGGTAAAALISYNKEEVITSIYDAIFYKPLAKRDYEMQLARVVKISKLVKAKGPLALEQIASTMNDPILRKGLQLIADSTSKEKIRYTLEIESKLLSNQIKEQISIISSVANISPALGLIGTVVGLVQMLGNISSSAALGTGMSIALLTTLYGAVLSYLILQPLAIKLEKKLREKELLDQLTLEGIDALQEGLNPILVEERLSPFAA